MPSVETDGVTRPETNLPARAKERIESIAEIPSQANTAIDNFLENRSKTTLQTATLGVIASSTFVGTAAAQSAGDAQGVICGTPAADALAILASLIVVGLTVKAIFQGALALDAMNGQSSSSKSSGRDKLKSAGFTAAGALAIPVIAGIFQRIGMPVLNCVNWTGFI